MSIISAVKTYLKTYSGLKSGAPVWVDYLGPTPTEYAVMPASGARTVEQYINGGSMREFPFTFQAMRSTADELERLETVGFYEAFADWLETQSNTGALPTLGAKQTPTKIEAVTWGYLFEEGNSETGIYQILCKLTYEQTP
jgi:hypothetical protein